MGRRPLVRPSTNAGTCDKMDRQLQGISDPAEAGELQSRFGDGEDAAHRGGRKLNRGNVVMRNDDDNANSKRNSKLSRRNMLLAGTALAAASTVGGGTPTRVAQAQQRPPAPSGQRPNILVIF